MLRKYLTDSLNVFSTHIFQNKILISIQRCICTIGGKKSILKIKFAVSNFSTVLLALALVLAPLCEKPILFASSESQDKAGMNRESFIFWFTKTNLQLAPILMPPFEV